jgi:hypothetical protein
MVILARSIANFWCRFSLPLLLFCWLWFGGSYSLFRDLLGILAVTTAFLVGRHFALSTLFVRFPSQNDAPSQKSASGTYSDLLTPSFISIWALSCWIALSGLDMVFEARPVPLRGGIATPTSTQPEYARLRVAVALSGGGYRAALVHAGVLDELSRRLSASSSAKGGHGLAGLGGFAEVGFLVLPEVVHVEVTVGFEPVFMGFDD